MKFLFNTVLRIPLMKRNETGMPDSSLYYAYNFDISLKSSTSKTIRSFRNVEMFILSKSLGFFNLTLVLDRFLLFELFDNKIILPLYIYTDEMHSLRLHLRQYVIRERNVPSAYDIKRHPSSTFSTIVFLSGRKSL